MVTLVSGVGSAEASKAKDNCEKVVQHYLCDNLRQFPRVEQQLQ